MKINKKEDWLDKQKEAENIKPTWYLNNKEDEGFGIWFALNCILFSFLLFVGPFAKNKDFTIIFIVLCIGLLPGMFIYILIKKEFPNNIYWIALLIVILTSILIVISSYMS